MAIAEARSVGRSLTATAAPSGIASDDTHRLEFHRAGDIQDAPPFLFVAYGDLSQSVGAILSGFSQNDVDACRYSWGDSRPRSYSH